MAKQKAQFFCFSNNVFVPVPNQACSGTDSNNAWRPYEDNSAALFNHMMVYDIVLNLLI